MKMYIAGEWIDKSAKMEVLNPYDGSVIDTVPKADRDDVERAIASAARGAGVMAALPAHVRYRILHRTAELLEERLEELARLITLEEGKVLGEALAEVARAVQTITLSAEEAKRLYGETLPMDASPGAESRFGLTIRVPCGVVLAISPFNFPLNLVCHKVGPALAAGNAVIVKPASDTPLSALKLTELLLEAGLPEEGIQCITGSGSTVGLPLCADPRVRKITFTGSRDVGEQICRVAGIKKVTLELGSNSPLIIMRDAELERAAQVTASNGLANAGQVCISAQRVLVDKHVYGSFVDALTPAVRAFTTGNPLDETVKMGPMIREQDAARVNSWIREAVSEGARVVVGGEYAGTMHAPTVLTDVDPKMRVFREELFGPAMGLTGFDSIDEAIALANDSAYGLSAGVFTENVHWALQFARRVHSGNIMINWGPQWRADLMPYGGLKESGLGKEGPKYAVEEMTELKTVIFH
ncbi:MAG: aldehyde dehydrogenase family protein [Gemmatimonadetes bacterium]|nr:aldehyde dehydrogenase family protein [Gemmatimonadota bacterium]